MKKIIIILLAIYGFSAHCEALQIRADHQDPEVKDGTIHDWGSGVYVGKYHVLTCAHTLEGQEKVFIKVKDGWARCDVLKLDKKSDLALLRTRVEGTPVDFVLLPAMTISGAPGKFPPDLIKVRETAAELDGAYIKANVDCGDSGGPVMVDGKLIGIVAKKVNMDEGVYAKIIGVDKIAEFLHDGRGTRPD